MKYKEGLKDICKMIEYASNHYGRTLCVFDLDGTLTPLNTTEDFIESIPRYCRSVFVRLLYYLCRIPIMRRILYLIARLICHNNPSRCLDATIIGWSVRLCPSAIDRFLAHAILEGVRRHGDVWRIFVCAKHYCSVTLVLTKTLIPLRFLEVKLGVPMLNSKIVKYGPLYCYKDIEKRDVIGKLLARNALKPLLTVSNLSEELYDYFLLKLLVKQGNIHLRISKNP